MKKHLALVLSALLGSMPVLASQAPSIDVPRGPAVTVDGRWDETEWSGAAIRGEEGFEVAFLATEGLLQIGIRSSPVFVASLCVERGEEVHIFHASSALGHAVYVREAEGDGWRLSRNFEWRLRKKDLGSEPEAERKKHRSEHGWVASTIEMDRPDSPVEFQIASSYFSGGPARAAVGLLLRGESPSVDGWPLGADEDGCTTRSVIAGPLPERATFDTSRWGILSIRP